MRYCFNSILLSLCALTCAGCPTGTVLTFTTSVEVDDELPELRPGDSYQVNIRQNSDADGVALPYAEIHRTSALVTESRIEGEELTLSLFVVAGSPAFEPFEEGAGYQLDLELTGVLDAPVDGGVLPSTV